MALHAPGVGYLRYGDLFFLFFSRGSTREHDNKTPGSPPARSSGAKCIQLEIPNETGPLRTEHHRHRHAKGAKKKCQNCRATLIPTINLGRERGDCAPQRRTQGTLRARHKARRQLWCHGTAAWAQKRENGPKSAMANRHGPPERGVFYRFDEKCPRNEARGQGLALGLRGNDK